METYVPLVNSIINNDVFHSSPHINQTMLHTLLQIIHILHFYFEDSLPNYTPDFPVNWIEAMAVRWPQLWRDECVAGGSFSSCARHGISSDTSDQDREIVAQL